MDNNQEIVIECAKRVNNILNACNFIMCCSIVGAGAVGAYQLGRDCIKAIKKHNQK